MNEIWERVLANSFSGIHKSKIICSAGSGLRHKHSMRTDIGKPEECKYLQMVQNKKTRIKTGNFTFNYIFRDCN